MRARAGSPERLPASGGPLLGPFPGVTYEIGPHAPRARRRPGPVHGRPGRGGGRRRPAAGRGRGPRRPGVRAEPEARRDTRPDARLRDAPPRQRRGDGRPDGADPRPGGMSGPRHPGHPARSPEMRNRPTDPSPGGAWLAREVIAARARRFYRISEDRGKRAHRSRPRRDASRPAPRGPGRARSESGGLNDTASSAAPSSMCARARWRGTP